MSDEITNKLVYNDTFNYGIEEFLVKIVDDPDVMHKKIASAIRDSWGDISPEKGRTLIHIIALGAFEKTGMNSNADAFEEHVCKRSHEDFVKRARLYRHHRKTAEEEKDGDIIKSAYNDKQGRVELILSAINDKCADWLGKLEKTGSANFSMGWSCTDGDICTICNNRAHRRSEYCEHLKKNAAAPYGLGKVLPDGRQCGTYNRDGFWNDLSYVDRGADMIAMDLAKIASINPQDVMGGAELYELFAGDGETISIKEKVANRIYDMFSKALQNGTLSPICESSPISKKASDDLLKNTPKQIFGYFNKKGYIMPFALFCKCLSPHVSKEAANHIQNAQDYFSEYVSDIYSDKERMKLISKVGMFDSVPSVNIYLSSDSDREFDKRANIVDNDEAMYIMVNNALNKQASYCTTTPKTKVAKALVENYIAYKISAVSKKEVNDQMLFDLFLLN